METIETYIGRARSVYEGTKKAVPLAVASIGETLSHYFSNHDAKTRRNFSRAREYNTPREMDKWERYGLTATLGAIAIGITAGLARIVYNINREQEFAFAY